MYYTIYKITNKINNKIYIGSHKTSDLEDDYMGSGVHLKCAQTKYGIENFDKEIIFRAVSSDIMYWVERMLVDEEFVKSDETYNLKVGGNGGFDYINSSGLNNKNGDNFINARQIYKIKLDDTVYRDKIHKIKSEAFKKAHKDGKIKYDTFSGKTHTYETKRKIGEANSVHQLGEGNSQFGTMWIHNLDLKESKKIKKDDFPTWEQEGWLKGRKMKF